MALDQNLSAEEQAQFDAMRAADAQPGSEAAAGTTVAPSADQPGTGEPGDQPAADKPAEQPQNKTVPHQAFHAERELRKERERELAEERKNARILHERTNLILERLGTPQTQPQQPAAPAIPELEKDPVGHIVGTMQHQGATLQQIVGALTQFGQQNQQQQAVTELQRWSSAVEREFSAATPDYAKAVEHLTAARHQELTEMGYADPVQRQQIITGDALAVAARAREQGKNPASVIYALAKQRGYAVPAAGNGATAQPDGAQIGQQPNAEERLRTVAAGQEQARSLSATRGGAPAPLTAARLIEMPYEEFEKMIATPEGKALLGA